jgi:WD40 repeat protein
MFGLKSTARQTWKKSWQHQLTEYVTQIVWSPDGEMLIACSAAGEIMVQVFSNDLALPPLNLATAGAPITYGASAAIDQLAFSADGRYLASGDQAGQVRVWERQGHQLMPLMTIDRSGCWIEQLRWHPTEPLLAFNVKHTVEVLQITTQSLVAQLDFENSSVLCLEWHPTNGMLMAGGYQSIKVWDSYDWQSEPIIVSIAAASLKIVCSPDGKYLASGNLDRTITILEWEEANPNPWVMTGFPGKISHLVWSSLLPTANDALLASASAEGVVVWERNAIFGWKEHVLDSHVQAVKAIAFQPQRRQLASAGSDGAVNIWNNDKNLACTLTDASEGFSCLAWHPWQQSLAAGGSQGEVFMWSQVHPGRGFGKY